MKKILLPVFIIIIVISSCTEKIDIELNRQGYSRIVIDGLITDEAKKHTIKITRTVDYSNPSAPEMVTGAMVTITCENKTWVLTESTPGIYQTSDTVKGIPGKTYEMRVLIGTEEFTATCEMKKPMQIDSIALKDFPHGDPPEQPHFTLHLFAQDNPEKKEFFIFKYYKNDILWDTIRYWGFYFDEYYNGLYLYDEMIQIINITSDSKIKLESYSVPEDYFWYGDQMLRNTEPSMFFMGPPANIKGNISNGGLGYFLASSVRQSPVVDVKYIPKN